MEYVSLSVSPSKGPFRLSLASKEKVGICVCAITNDLCISVYVCACWPDCWLFGVVMWVAGISWESNHIDEVGCRAVLG